MSHTELSTDSAVLTRMKRSHHHNCSALETAEHSTSGMATGGLVAGLALASLLAMGSATANNATPGGPGGDFAVKDLKGWNERSFKGNTRYELVQKDGASVLKGHTRGNASILYREQPVNLTETPIITWSWKVNDTFQGIDELSQAGDDFPARLYVVAKVGFLPWDTLALNYVWASEMPVGESWANPFTDKAHMIAVQSGSTQVGQWITQQRDLEADFRNYFGTAIDEIQGYAVMVDGDNANKEATAWFGAIDFSARP